MECISPLRKEEDISGSVMKPKVPSGLEGLKVLCSWEEGHEKRVPVSRSHRDKRFGKCIFRLIPI